MRRPAPARLPSAIDGQRRLADPRRAAEQHERAGHEPAAEHAVELADPGLSRAIARGLDVGEPDGLHGARPAAAPPRRAARAGARALLDERVPLPAARALPVPLRRARGRRRSRRRRSPGVAMVADSRRRAGRFAPPRGRLRRAPAGGVTVPRLAHRGRRTRGWRPVPPARRHDGHPERPSRASAHGARPAAPGAPAAASRAAPRRARAPSPPTPAACARRHGRAPMPRASPARR